MCPGNTQGIINQGYEDNGGMGDVGNLTGIIRLKSPDRINISMFDMTR